MAFRTSIKPLVFFFSQNYTDEQISQRRTETLSQPIAQSVSANVKGSGPSLSCSSFFFSQNYTDEQISQRRTETLSQPMTQSVSANVKGSGPSPNPSPEGKGRSMWGYPYRAADKRIKRSVHPHYRGISVITPLPFGGGVGEGPLSLSCSPFSLTELHRRTEIAKAHRDVKSTDNTERYNQN